MPTFEGRPVEQRHRDMLTEFQRQLRKMTREYAEKRNRPLLLAVVVPETVEISRDAGIDIEVWLKEQLVDMVIAGNGYVPFSTSMATLQMVELGHKYGVPVYPQINANTGDGLFKRNIEVWRAAGMNFWSTGGDGICLFNLIDMDGEAGKMTRRILTEIGDPAKIARQDKLYAADIDLETAGYGFGDVRFYMYRQNLVPMPLALPGSYVEFSVGDNLQGAAKEGILSELKLRLLIEGLAASDTLSLNFNGKTLGGKQADAAFKANPESHWREYDLNASDVKNGTNRIDAELTLSRSTKTAPSLSRLELSVRYRI